jgi:hypothetical protein
MHVAGPYDDASRKLETPDCTVGPDGCHFLVGLDEIGAGGAWAGLSAAGL